MQGIMKHLAIAFLLLAAVAGLPKAASACYYACIQVSEFCERCEYAGGFTGGYCQNVGSCGCRDVQGICDGATTSPASGGTSRSTATAESRALAAIFADPAAAPR